MQNQDSGATADFHDENQRECENNEDDQTAACTERLAEATPKTTAPYAVKRCHESQLLQMIRQQRPPVLPPIRESPSDDHQALPIRHSRLVCGAGTPGKIHRHVAKSDMTSGVSDRVAFVGISGSSAGVSLCRGAHHSVPVRRHDGAIPSGCLGVLPFIRRESLERVAEEDDISLDGAKSMVASDTEAGTVRCTTPMEPRSVRVTVRPPTPIPLSDFSAPGCSRPEKLLDTDEARPAPESTTPPLPLRESSSENSTSSTTSSEWSAILEKVKALEPVATQARAPDRMTSVGSSCCRICQSSNNPELLISPCRCKGSLAYVHLSCLERWLNQSGRTYCELCQFRFNAIQTPRYRLFQSMRLWYCHPRHRRQLLADAVIAVILTCVTLGLVSIIILGMRYFILEGAKLGVSAQCIRFTVTFFLAVVTSGYFVTMYLLVKDEVSPWLHWRRTTVNVRVLLDSSVLQGQPLRTEAASRLLPNPRSKLNTLSRVWGQAQTK